MRTICLCNSTLPWGGGEFWHLSAARSLAERGWRVLLLCHPEGELCRRAQALAGVEVIPLAIHRLSFLNPLLRGKISRILRANAVHAVIMNLPADLKAVGPAARSAGVRHIVYRRGSALPVRDSLLNRRLYGRIITRLIVNSQATKAQVLSRNPRLIPEDRITILGNGVDIARFDALLAEAATGAPGIDCLADGEKRPFVIGNAGRLNRQKGQHMLIELGSLLSARGLDFRIVIAGVGEREAELKRLAARAGIADRVEFAGFLDDLSPFWQRIDCFVLTSLWEGFGNVVIEAGLARKPVFAFAVSNLPEIVHSGPEGNGRLFPLPGRERADCPDAETEDAAENAALGSEGASDGLEQMADAIVELAACPEEAKRMGENGRRQAEGYSQESRMDALEALLR